jgi:15-cis-phytoene synthase
MAAPQSQEITRKSASNLALAFILLPREKRDAMAALYAFCREVDDVTDEDSHAVEDRRRALQRWREDVRLACNGGAPVFGVNRELQPFICRHNLKFELFDELIRGCETDLVTTRQPDFAGLEIYCHRVASVVGLLSIEIFGYTRARTRDYAVALGKALQLTNILRDVRNDAARGRIYLPQDAMGRHGVNEADVLAGKFTPQYETLARELAERARDFYRIARNTLPDEDRRAMVAAELMGTVYWELFCELERRRFNVFDLAMPLKLGRPRKLTLIASAWLRHLSGRRTGRYG